MKSVCFCFVVVRQTEVQTLTQKLYIYMCVEESTQAKTKVVVIDLANADDNDWQRVGAALSKLKLGVLST
jgi:hypothetical protein